jgi:hypothetical protein
MDQPEAFGIGSAAAVLMLASEAAAPMTANHPLRMSGSERPDDGPPRIDDWETCWPADKEVRPRSPSR